LSAAKNTNEMLILLWHSICFYIKLLIATDQQKSYKDWLQAISRKERRNSNMTPKDRTERLSPSRLQSRPRSAMFSRNSHRALAFLALTGTLFLLTFSDAAWLRTRRAQALGWKTELVVRLGLTDLCLFTDARYTRHPSQADLHSAFQDHPISFEHFPSGSILPPPRRANTNHANLDRETKVLN
jgi:hypothetical protein